MSTYPTAPRAKFLAWCEVHDDIFLDHAAAIGMTPEQAAAFAGATAAAKAAILAQAQARQAALVATQAAKDAIMSLREEAGLAVRTIRAFAESQSGGTKGGPTPDEVYQLAQIPAPAAPSPAPPPAKPRRLSVALDAVTGALTLRWKVSNPAGTSGTTYLVRRRLPGETAFSLIGVTGRKQFVDATLMAGVEGVQYTVQGQRGRHAGPVSEVFVASIGRKAEPPRRAAAAEAGNGQALTPAGVARMSAAGLGVARAALE